MLHPGIVKKKQKSFINNPLSGILKNYQCAQKDYLLIKRKQSKKQELIFNLSMFLEKSRPFMYYARALKRWLRKKPLEIWFTLLILYVFHIYNNDFHYMYTVPQKKNR